MKTIILEKEKMGARILADNLIAIERENMSGNMESVYINRDQLVELIKFIDENKES